MNRGQCNALASLFAGDPNMTRFASYYNDAANRANEQFVFDTGCLRKKTTYTIVASTATYDIPSDFLWPVKATHKGLKIDPISEATLEDTYRNTRWDELEGTPRFFISNPDEDAKDFRVFPIPGASDTGANTVLKYVYKPAEMTADSDELLDGTDLLVPYHIAVALYQAWLLLGYETASPEVIAKRAALLKQYKDKTLECSDRFKETASEPLRMRGGRAW